MVQDAPNRVIPSILFLIEKKDTPAFFKSELSKNIYNNSNGTGWAHHNNDCPTDNYSTGWYIRLLQDSTFNNELRCAYENYRQTILDTTYIFTYIDSIKNLVQNAQERHFKKWPILGMSGPAPEIGAIATTYNAELDTLKGWINLRLQWLDANIPGVCSNTGVSTFNISNGIKCYPNPTNNYFNIEYSLSVDDSKKIKASTKCSINFVKIICYFRDSVRYISKGRVE